MARGVFLFQDTIRGEVRAMPVLASVETPGGRRNDSGRARTKGQIEAEISKALIRFEREQLGRGPADIRTQIVQDMVIVRMVGMLTPEEHALVRAGGEELLKQVRTKLIDHEREALSRLLREATGRQVASMYSDLCPQTGERLIVFVLRECPEMR
jgi:uncharacterized protein YbcI